jgi:putative ABC transport system permease protein
MFVLGVFAAVALVLSCVGIFGVVSYLVNQRTQEIGVRMALGARPVDVLWLVLSEGGRLALVGIAVGTAAALALTGTISSLLFGVSPTDPMTFGSIAVLLLGTTLLACYVPARRAAHVDPMTALRAE